MKSMVVFSLFKGKRTTKFLISYLTSLFLLAVFQLTGCGLSLHTDYDKPSPKKTTNPVNAEFEKNRRLWQENKIVNYNFVSTKFGGGIYAWVPVFIQVRNSQKVSMEPARARKELERIDGYEDFDTVEKIFARIQEAYEKGYIVNVIYNTKFGYPERITIDDLSDAHSAFVIEISKFEVVNTN